MINEAVDVRNTCETTSTGKRRAVLLVSDTVVNIAINNDVRDGTTTTVTNL